jgi:hypothetical protein
MSLLLQIYISYMSLIQVVVWGVGGRGGVQGHWLRLKEICAYL